MFYDPMHSQREDRVNSFEVNNTLKYSADLDFSIGFGWSNRRVNAPAPIVATLKNYDRWTTWIRVGYYYE